MVFDPLKNDGGLALLIPAAYAIDSRGIGIFDIVVLRDPSSLPIRLRSGQAVVNPKPC